MSDPPLYTLRENIITTYNEWLIDTKTAADVYAAVAAYDSVLEKKKERVSEGAAAPQPAAPSWRDQVKVPKTKPPTGNEILQHHKVQGGRTLMENAVKAMNRDSVRAAAVAGVAGGGIRKRRRKSRRRKSHKRKSKRKKSYKRKKTKKRRRS